ncbi:MAG: hypothetical protein CMJ48_02475 [Planctomycetaceae bacterium]|nr:hypothetical protein [Planctomycetaceae bacterium]
MNARRTLRWTLSAATLLFASGVLARADGQQSVGNTDGVLNWSLGELAPGSSARRTVLFVSGTNAAEAVKTLARARAGHRSGWSDRLVVDLPAPATGQDGKDVWIKNDSTNFALAPDGGFFWETGHIQSLRRGSKGQLSRLGFFIHYRNDADRHAGIRISGSPRLDGVQVVRPTQKLADDRCVTELKTADGALRIQIRTAMGKGAVVAQEYVLTNTSDKPIAKVRLSAYANLEADHSHGNDHSLLDDVLGALVTIDAANQSICLMAGLDQPASGWSGRWPSQSQLAAGSGLALEKWVAVKDLAPIQTPQTAAAPAVIEEPETVSLTQAAADKVLQADWLMQAEGGSLLVRASEEITWARNIAGRLARMKNPTDVSTELAELVHIEKKLAALRTKDGDANAERGLYLAVRKIKREIVMANPLVDFERVLFIDQPYPHGGEWRHQARHRNGMMATPGGRLLMLDGLSPAGKLRKLGGMPIGSYWKPDVSFDGKRALFCFKPADDEAFHIYECDLETDRVTQLTDGPYDDLDPIYLPDGGIAFSSTRTQTYVRCMPYTYVYTLFRMDADGGHIRCISHNNEPDWTPLLLDDGRLIYSRWEYTDKALWRIQSIWTVRPDGTQHESFYGNQSVWPDHLGEARPIPGTGKVLFTGTAHHNYFAGTLGIIDPREGRDYPAGLTHVTSEVPWPECGAGPHDGEIAVQGYHHRGRKGDYKSPYPLSEEYFLVSVNTGPFSLYLMDVYGNKELLYRGAHNILYGMPVRPRTIPPALPDLVAWPDANRKEQEPGVIFSNDVYEGSGIPQGAAKHIRVIQSDHKTYTTWDRDFRTAGPATSAVQEDSVKRILGTAPVESDGSFFVEVPSGVAVHFQLLDERYRALQTMRSFTGLMPGERRGCVGCHEGQHDAPAHGDALALRRTPSKLTPTPWGTESIGFERMIQPVLNSHCVKCHDGKEASSAPNLTARHGKSGRSYKLDSVIDLGWGTGPRRWDLFSESYLYLLESGVSGVMLVENYQQRDPLAYKTAAPMKQLSYNSRLLRLATSGDHYGVKVDDVSRRKLIGWIDTTGPYRGDPEVRAVNDPRCRDAPVVQRP